MALTLINYTANNTTAVQGAYRNKYDRLLTEWTGSSIPKLAGGTVIEVGGAAFLVSGDTTIGGTAPSADGDYYITVSSAGAVAWATSKNAYVWSESNGGWYNGTILLLPVTVSKKGTSYYKYLWTDIRNGEDIIPRGSIITQDKLIGKLDPVSGNVQNNTGIIFPMYIYPTSIYTNSTYNGVIELAKKYRHVPFIVVLNPASGPGTVTDGNYTIAIKRLQGANIKVIGYISTNYGAIAIATTKAAIAKWKELYPDIQGIFYDEQDYLAAGAPYYADLNAYAKRLGMDYTIGNTGTTFDEAYYLQDCADIFIGWESSTYPTLAQAKGDFAGGSYSYNLNRRGVLIHGESALDYTELDQLRKYYGWVFITDDAMPNPWDAVPSYFESLFKYFSEPAEVYEVNADIVNANDVNASTVDAATITGDDISGIVVTATEITDGTHKIKTKLIAIGGWDMQTTALKTVAHGLSTLAVRIVTLNAIIRRNGSIEAYPFQQGATGGSWWVDATNVNLNRLSTGTFNNLNFSGTTLNRGYIQITYSDQLVYT